MNIPFFCQAIARLYRQKSMDPRTKIDEKIYFLNSLLALIRDALYFELTDKPYCGKMFDELVFCSKYIAEMDTSVSIENKNNTTLKQLRNLLKLHLDIKDTAHDILESIPDAYSQEERELLAQIADTQDSSAEQLMIKLRQCKELIDGNNCLSNIEINLLLSDSRQ